MFKTGDKVFYPMHGAGIVTGIEQNVFDGTMLDYYVLSIPISNLQITVQVEKAERMGLRNINPKDTVDKIVKNASPIEMSSNWSERYKNNLEILKGGDLLKITEVFKTLILRERIKSLSTAEKKLLTTARQLIVTEIILSHNTDKQSAETLLNNTIQAMAVTA